MCPMCGDMMGAWGWAAMAVGALLVLGLLLLAGWLVFRLADRRGRDDRPRG